MRAPQHSPNEKCASGELNIRSLVMARKALRIHCTVTNDN